MAAILVNKNKKHLSPLGTKLHLPVTFEKNNYCIDHQHGRLVTGLQTNNRTSAIIEPFGWERNDEHHRFAKTY